MLAAVMWSAASVGRIPIITMWAPTSADLASAPLRSRRSWSSNVSRPPSRSLAGGTLISMLNRPSSVWNAGSAIAAALGGAPRVRGPGDDGGEDALGRAGAFVGRALQARAGPGEAPLDTGRDPLGVAGRLEPITHQLDEGLHHLPRGPQLVVDRV